MPIRRLKRLVNRVLYSALGAVMGCGIAFYIQNGIPSANAAITNARSVISTQSLELVDKTGHRVLLLTTTAAGSPGIWLFDRAGKSRLNLGLYEDGNPFMVLNDTSEQAVQVLRSVGENNSPVLVLKSQGQDRVIMGLNFDATQNPFLVYDQKGKKTAVFGKYQS